MIEELADRLARRDLTLWPEGSEAAGRLGWLDVAARSMPGCVEVQRWASSVTARRVVLLGMGGSSLGPEVLRSAHRSDRLVVLDTTDPATVDAVDIDGAFFLVSSKSGTTIEPRALAAHFWEKVPDGRRWAAITDPGTELVAEAEAKGFSRVFENDPSIGGRYSVLSWFGLVPAALVGIDISRLCRNVAGHARHLLEEGARLGVLMAEAQRAGRDKLTFHVPPGPFAAFGLWAEQLVAESLGKQGTGIVPVPTTEVETGPDREIVAVHVGDLYELGPLFQQWEVATAVAGSLMGVDPFDQPDVEASKVATRKALEALPLPPQVPAGADEVPAGDLLAWLEAHARPRDHVAIMAYLPYGQDRELEALRRAVRDRLGGMAVTAGYGPRFLHSTGQLHKGGPDSFVGVQLVPARPTGEVPVPGAGYDFATLIAAQALGDLEALAARGRRVVRVAVDRSPAEVLR